MILIIVTTLLTVLFYGLALAWTIPFLAYIGVFFMVLTVFFAICMYQAELWQHRLDKIIEEEGIYDV